MVSLDIGCGSNKNGGLGVDIKRTKDVDVLASATNLPFKDDSIDFIYTRRCLQHIPDDMLAIKEIHRVLKMKCESRIIVASYRGWIYYHLKHLFKRKHYAIFRLYLKRWLRNKVAKAGFSVKEICNIRTRKLGYDICMTVVK